MQKRILTGDNTTGRLHLGHYVGSLENRVKLQNDFETFIILADMHAFAYPKYVGNPEIIQESTLQVLMDNLAVGLDPAKVSFFAESAIPEIYEMAIMFSMLVSHNLALRNPTIKEEIRDKGLGDNYSLGFINYPVMQAADILAVKAVAVPIGEDQEPHLELTREVVRRLEALYGYKMEPPKAIASGIRRLIGTDGQAKMTKSIGNAIYLSETDEELKQKVMKMYTDPSRIHPTDPGKVEGNPVFIYHDAFNTDTAQVAELKERYTKGTVGDVEVKEKLYNALVAFLAPIREKRKYYDAHIDEVKDILSAGNKKTRIEAQKTLEEIKSAMKISSY